MSKALIQLSRKETSTKAKIELEIDRTLFAEINEYARFAKIPGRVLKDKRERLIVAMIEKILADDVAFAEYKADKKKAKATPKAKTTKVNKAKEEISATTEEREQAPIKK